MKHLLTLTVIALVCTACTSFQTAKKEGYYKDYYRPEGTQTPQEQVR